MSLSIRGEAVPATYVHKLAYQALSSFQSLKIFASCTNPLTLLLKQICLHAHDRCNFGFARIFARFVKILHNSFCVGDLFKFYHFFNAQYLNNTMNGFRFYYRLCAPECNTCNNVARAHPAGQMIKQKKKCLDTKCREKNLLIRNMWLCINMTYPLNASYTLS